MVLHTVREQAREAALQEVEQHPKIAGNVTANTRTWPSSRDALAACCAWPFSSLYAAANQRRFMCNDGSPAGSGKIACMLVKAAMLFFEN